MKKNSVTTVEDIKRFVLDEAEEFYTECDFWVDFGPNDSIALKLARDEKMKLNAILQIIDKFGWENDLVNELSEIKENEMQKN